MSTSQKLTGFFAYLIFLSVCYLPTGRWHLGDPVLFEPFHVDNQIPFIGWTFWAYVSLYVFIVLAFWLVNEKKDYEAMVASMIFCTFISALIFLFFPTTVPRAALITDSEPVRTMRLALYQLDPPTNCFPSLHVSFSMLAAIFMTKQKPQYGSLFVMWLIAIMISTMTFKQHYLVDVLGGTLLAIVGYQLSVRGYFYGRKQSKYQSQSTSTPQNEPRLLQVD